MKILGLHYDKPFVRWVVLERKGKKLEVASKGSFSSIDDVKRLYNTERKNLVATGINTLFRQLTFKISSMRKIEQGLPFQIESLTSLPIDQLTYACQTFLGKKRAETSVFLSAKENLIGHLNEWKELGIYPDVVSAIPKALLRFTEFRCPKFKNGVVVYLGSQEMFCISIRDSSLQKAFVIEEGIENLLSCLWEDRKKVLLQHEVKSVAKQIDLLQLKPHLNPHLSSRLEMLRNQLIAVFYSLQEPQTSFSILFAGRVDSFVNLPSYFLQNTAEINLYDPSLSLTDLKSAIAIGLAVEATSKERNKIQFLKGEFTPKRVWKKAGLFGASLLTASVVFSAVLGGIGLKNLELQKETLTDSLTEIISQIDKKVGRSLFEEGIESGVVQAAETIQKYDREAVFFVQAPTVSEVLSWLGNDSAFKSLEKEKDPIDITHFHYELVSFPKIGRTKDPYQAKIAIEFRLKHSMNARKLHEELLKKNSLIDRAQEFSWEAHEDGYKASFYLKNKEPYVR